MDNRVDMPKSKQILSFWKDKLIDKGKYWIDNEDTITCFACGCEVGTQRAHITPLCEGGTNNVDNLHLLCKECHTESELYSSESGYWTWFFFKEPANSGSYLRLKNKIAISAILREQAVKLTNK